MINSRQMSQHQNISFESSKHRFKQSITMKQNNRSADIVYKINAVLIKLLTVFATP